MTVSWMTPLIRTGFKRQLDDADVWQLGYEFQHRGLHANFRRLKGTVMQRLLTANGIDLVIITALGILETVLGFTVPVLLQKILSSMQDLDAPRNAAITYAAMTMGVQLINLSKRDAVVGIARNAEAGREAEEVDGDVADDESADGDATTGTDQGEAPSSE